MYELHEHLRQMLMSPGDHWSRKVRDSAIREIVDSVFGAFEKFKESKIGADGLVEIWEFHGLLSGATGWQSRRVDPRNVDAHQCAGQFVSNDIDLALLLLGENNPEFMAALFKHGFGEALWAIGAWSYKTAAIESLITLNAFFVRLLVSELGSAHRVGERMWNELRAIDQSKTLLAANARVGKVEKAKRERAAGKDTASQCKRAAIDYYKANPVNDRDQMATFVAPRLHVEPGTVKKYSAGAKREALKALAAERKLRG